MSKLQTGHRGNTFTLIELLVVIAIIAILASMLLPVLTRARGMAHQAACTGNQKQLSVMLELYVGDYDGYMPRDIYGTGAPNAEWLDQGKGLLMTLQEKYPALQVPADSVYGKDTGWETRLLVADLMSWDDHRIQKCPADNRQDWEPPPSHYWPSTDTPINPTRTPTISYIAAPCWSRGQWNYLDRLLDPAPWGNLPMRRDSLIGRRAANDELLFVHGGGAMYSLFVIRPFFTPQGACGGYWQEMHPGGIPPRTGLDMRGPYPGQLLRDDGTDQGNGGWITYVDFSGWGNPYMCMDGHVEYQKSIWHSDNLWHQWVIPPAATAYTYYPNGQAPWPGDGRAKAQADHF